MFIHITIILISFLSLLATYILYPDLPDEIAFHWNLAGEVDRFEKKWFVFITALLPLVLYGFMLILPKIDPRKDSYEKHKKTFKIVIVSILLFLFAIHWFTMAFALGYEVDIPFLIKICLAILFIILGVYMPKIEHNYTFGIRTPWTLANEECWKKTHKFGGYAFIITGVLLAILVPFKHAIVFPVVIGSIILLIITVIVYSYIAFKRINLT